MGEISRFIEAAIITAVFAAATVCLNYSAHSGCGHQKSAMVRIDRGPSRVAIN
jgi:hypothetical protein